MAVAAKDQSRLHSIWARRGFTLHRQDDPPHKKWAAHRHNVDEIVRLIAGRIVVDVEGEPHRPRPGVDVIVPKQKAHRIYNPTGQRALYFYGFRSKRKK